MKKVFYVFLGLYTAILIFFIYASGVVISDAIRYEWKLAYADRFIITVTVILSIMPIQLFLYAKEVYKVSKEYGLKFDLYRVIFH